MSDPRITFYDEFGRELRRFKRKNGKTGIIYETVEEKKQAIRDSVNKYRRRVAQEAKQYRAMEKARVGTVKV